MRRASPGYLATVFTAVFLATVLALNDFELPILWSTCIGIAVASWLILMLWATTGSRTAHAVEMRGAFRQIVRRR